MRRSVSRITLVVVAIAAVACAPSIDPPSAVNGVREIDLDVLRDKVRGGWAGQMIGVSYGAPTEFRYLERLIPEADLPEWIPEMVRGALDQDDLCVEMTFAQVLDEVGLDATADDFGAMFRKADYRLWHANLSARRALRRGVPATESGTPKYNAHANDIDFQIEADFVGLMTPGMPNAGIDLCWRAGQVMNYGDGIYGGMFVTGMYSAAFFETDARAVVEAGLATLPAGSPYAMVISDVLAWSREHPGDWEAVWQLIEDKWNDREPCPAGAMRAFNIDAKLYGAYIALGLLYGEGDLDRTLDVSTRAGQDSDCNPSNALGVLGVMLGYDALPTRWTSGIPAIADEKFSYTEFSFNGIVDSTIERAIAMAERHGGGVEEGVLRVPMQEAEAAELVVWDDYGSPVERVNTDDARFSFNEAWQRDVRQSWRAGDRPFRVSAEQGAEMTVTFEGTGAILVGPWLPDGGMADVYLDDEPVRTIDVYSDEVDAKGSETVWHAFGLEDAGHTVRLVVRGEPYGESAGAQVVIEDLVIFR